MPPTDHSSNLRKHFVNFSRFYSCVIHDWLPRRIWRIQRVWWIINCLCQLWRWRAMLYWNIMEWEIVPSFALTYPPPSHSSTFSSLDRTPQVIEKLRFAFFQNRNISRLLVDVGPQSQQLTQTEKSGPWCNTKGTTLVACYHHKWEVGGRKHTFDRGWCLDFYQFDYEVRVCFKAFSLPTYGWE